ncbi:hypothetical protein FE840_010025 [Peteryoungia desertarenae]|uniref:DUF3313 domain-containing protein n=1 Tax=Peteryoungia desertarenae TaxID=1813451 RepID=A0ABX6QMY0_9HYPH|nr:hypothetical protein [Peteryoungia desertarenae]QLF69849.1 hypothetical protein FE840_010025 [Peteryoungia desertarenae]
MIFMPCFFSDRPFFQAVRYTLAAALLSLLAACQAPSAPQGSSSLAQYSLAEITVDYSQLNQPLLVSDLEGDINRSVSSSAIDGLGTRLGLTNQQARQAAMQQAINAHITPHLRDQLTPLFKGTRPARAEVVVYSVFIRSRLSLQQLTGAEVTIDGVRRPDTPQLVAGLRIYDVQTGQPLQEIAPITKTDDGSITVSMSGPKAPEYGASPRLNKLAFDFAREAANALSNAPPAAGFGPGTVPGPMLGGPATGSDVRTLWSMQKVE